MKFRNQPRRLIVDHCGRGCNLSRERRRRQNYQAAASSYVNIVKSAARRVSGFYPLIARQPPSPSTSSIFSSPLSQRSDSQRMSGYRAAVAVTVALLSVKAFELETGSTTVECVQCVQLWKSASAKESKACGPHAKTCSGDACYMRQCKHCPVYQYMSGCVQLSPWQLADLEANRKMGELRMRRVGAELLCEDSFNQTTCICNRRDKCNSIHSRLPYSTYGDGLFKGVIDFDQVIGALDPRYLEVISGYQYRFSQRNSGHLLTGFFFLPFLFLL